VLRNQVVLLRTRFVDGGIVTGEGGKKRIGAEKKFSVNETARESLRQRVREALTMVA
jgi:hypothetical protein